MPISVESRRKSLEKLEQTYPAALIFDVTSRGEAPWVKFSPFYPHGGIPVPLSPGYAAQSVEGIWQALKVFERADIDLSKLDITTMKDIKRTARKYGAVLGHRDGVEGTGLLDYRTARYTIYMPAYRYVLDHHLTDALRWLDEQSRSRHIILLDYETNADPDDLSSPLSHAALIVRYLSHEWPES